METTTRRTLETSANRLMWVGDERVLYAGLLGEPSLRTMGAVTLYVALAAPLRVRIDGNSWQCCEAAIVQPYVPHEVACNARLIGGLWLEPESLDAARLPPLLRRSSGPFDDPAFVARVRAGHAALRDGGGTLTTRSFDERFFGAALPERRIDARIERVLQRLRADPARALSAAECAAEAGLSPSRFLHLFKAELGVSLRTLRSWKRARSLLHHVRREASLAHVALDSGYPDSTHFSHSIRQVYGLRPKDIFAGSRRLSVLSDAGTATGRSSSI
jgi:AraC-like DNA-binding protein